MLVLKLLPIASNRILQSRGLENLGFSHHNTYHLGKVWGSLNFPDNSIL
jgi:hypothetical protein